MIIRKFNIILLIITAALFIAVTGCKKGVAQTVPDAQPDPRFVEISDKNDAFYKGYFQVVGQGEGDNKSMALLAARAMAQARLVEIVNGVEVERQSLVEQGKLASDKLQISTKGLLRFASVCGERYNPADKTAEVCMRLGLRTGNFGDLVEHLIKDVE